MLYILCTTIYTLLSTYYSKLIYYTQHYICVYHIHIKYSIPYFILHYIHYTDHLPAGGRIEGSDGGLTAA